MLRGQDVCPLAAVQNQYSPVWRAPERELFSLCETMKIAFVAYSPLGNGFLSGRFTQDSRYAERDFRSFMGRFSKKVMARNQPLLDLVTDFAQSKHLTPAQAVLAWELAMRPFIIPIPGTTGFERLEENLKAAQAEFSAAELASFNDALAKLTVDETYF